jgi:ribonuclease Z
MLRTKRIVFSPLLLLLACSLLPTGCSNQVMSLMERQIAANMTSPRIDSLADGLHVLVCGAGGPLPAENRTPACLLVIAGDQVLLFDAGGGSARTMALNGFQPPLIERVFLTHFHSDHIDGLGEIATLRWAGGPWEAPLPVHGPHGVAEVVSGFNLAYRRDQTYRTAHHGLAVTPPKAAGLSAAAFDLPPEGEAPIVFEDGALRVRAYRVDHDPVRPAVGYRIEYKDRSISISGDTARSVNLIAMSRGVDVLFHEALSRELVGVVNQAARNAGNAKLEKITLDILDYHASPVEAAESAEEAGVGALVVYHVVPPLPLAPLERIFRAGMSDVYSGPIEVSVDGTFVSLPTGSTAIEIESP